MVAIVGIVIACMLSLPLAISMILGELFMALAIIPHKDNTMMIDGRNLKDDDNIGKQVDSVMVVSSLEILTVNILFRLFDTIL